MGTVLYYAYGSNLDIVQMRSRCPAARLVSRAVLPGSALVFGGYSARWRGGVATVVPRRGSSVDGLLYRMDRFEVLMLDHFEGCPWAYCRVQRTVVDERGRRRDAYVYLQPNRGLEFRAPGLEYWEVILRAYERLNFDIRPLLSAEGVRP